MSSFDVANADIIADVSLVDASTQDHSTGDPQFPGLHNDLSFLWAMVDTEDGKRYEIVRSLSQSCAYDFTVHECPADIWEKPRGVRIPGETDLYWGPAVWLGRGERRRIMPANLDMMIKHPMNITLSPTKYIWQEEDVVDIELTPLTGNVTRIDVTGDPDPVGYTSSGCSVAGTVDGKKITGGYGGIDRMYCIPGLSAQLSKIAWLEHYWFVWGAIHEDGTWETGNAMLGAGGYATATWHRQGFDPIIATNADVESKVVWEDRENGESQPVSASLTFGGRTFDFTTTHNAAAQAASLGIKWVHGRVQEKGGPVPVRTWSTMEVIVRGAETATPR